MTDRGARAAAPTLALAAALTLAGALALAAPAPPPPRLFLSPSGEPFRLGPDDPDPLKAWFDQAETKHQGFLDRQEFRADATRMFKKFDTNGDGMIDGFEAADYETNIVPELKQEVYGAPGAPSQPEAERPHGGRTSGRGAPDAAQGEGKARPRKPGRALAQLINEPEPVTGADFNLDSHITLAEWLTATDQRFDILDTGKTGRLTLEDLRAKLIGPAPPSQQRRQQGSRGPG